ncbi:MAG: LysR substrate-binding domain-containing protein [Pigmentiphaga sp.]|nr:LysR substrate-binding domain-containing protein [Pigmentiphaga sp.]
MNLRQMEVFRAVMLTGTVAGAAQLLHVSQPGVSKVLAAAEARLRVPLFVRSRGRLVPTSAAHQLYAEIGSAWTHIERVRQVARDLGVQGRRRLFIMASPSLGACVMPKAISLLTQRWPDSRVRLELTIPKLLIDDLVEQNDNAVGAALFDVQHPWLEVLHRYQYGMVCVMPEGHPLSRLDSVQPADLLGHKIIAYPAEPAYRVSDAMIYGDLADEMDIAVEVRSGQSACALSLMGAGVAVVEAIVVADALFPSLVVRPFATSARFEVQLVQNRRSPLAELGQAFCETFDQAWHAFGLPA